MYETSHYGQADRPRRASTRRPRRRLRHPGRVAGATEPAELRLRRGMGRGRVTDSGRRIRAYAPAAAPAHERAQAGTPRASARTHVLHVCAYARARIRQGIRDVIGRTRRCSLSLTLASTHCRRPGSHYATCSMSSHAARLTSCRTLTTRPPSLDEAPPVNTPCTARISHCTHLAPRVPRVPRAFGGTASHVAGPPSGSGAAARSCVDSFACASDL